MITIATIRIVDGTTAAGNRVVRAVDVNGIAAACAILVDGRWLVSSYEAGTPVSALETRSETDAREWVQWLGEQMVAHKS
ncbi:hypothetical protein [Mycolicibacterium mageritense]|uniref:hypothetical protein n=1 Tax=Mycolicibacterium mageritense TaxID=53462 RepID=UPI001E3D8F99|nr:hypothetical protein [Mycolicibacterium mageritense]GJJ23130.1 hypothetical protein MTY414_68030 [Mycolicibacterium mageritense]